MAGKDDIRSIEVDDYRDLPIIPPDDYCNARTRSGHYCRNRAGLKTSHPGTGRCYLHGGCGGRPPAQQGLYAGDYGQTLAEKAEAIRSHPELFNLYAELTLLKTLIGSVIHSLPEDVNRWFDDGMGLDAEGKRVRIGTDEHAKLRTLIRLQESCRKTFRTITEAEERAKVSLSFNELMTLLEQIRKILDSHCRDCPHRRAVADQIIAEVRVPSSPGGDEYLDAEWQDVEPTGLVADAKARQKLREKQRDAKRKERARKKAERRSQIGGEEDDELGFGTDEDDE